MELEGKEEKMTIGIQYSRNKVRSNAPLARVNEESSKSQIINVNLKLWLVAVNTPAQDGGPNTYPVAGSATLVVRTPSSARGRAPGFTFLRLLLGIPTVFAPSSLPVRLVFPVACA